MRLSRKKIIKIVALFLYFYVGLFICLVSLQRNFIYVPMTTQRPDISKSPDMQWISVTTQDGLELKAWYKAPAADQPTLVYFHGNGSNIENRIPRAEFMISQGYGLLLAEYRGYGGNPGQPSEEGFYSDARAYMDLAIEFQRQTKGELVLYGESLGTGVAVQMATEYEIDGIVLETPFTNIVDVARSKFPMYPFIGYFMYDHYRSDQKIADLDMPIFLAVAGQDEVIPRRFGERLYGVATQPKQIKIYDQASHVGIYSYGFADDLKAFLGKKFSN